MTHNVTGQTFGVKNLDALAIGRTPIYPIVTEPNNPVPQNVNYPLYQLWFNSNTDEGWILESFSTLGGVFTANWSKFGHGDLGLETLTGNTGGAVGVDSNYNINTIGATPYTVTGSPSTHTLTWSDNGTIAYQYTTNNGTAIPASNNLNVFGDGTSTFGSSTAPNIWTTGSGSTITIQPTKGQTITNYTNVNSAASPYTVLATDFYISVDCSGGTVTLNFPNAPNADQYWIVKDRTGSASTNNISITTPGGSVTIDGLTTYKLVSNYAAVTVLGNSTPTYEVF